MKKTLAALAVLGAFSGAAFAQSNVQVYGLVDGGLQFINPSVDALDSTFGLASGQQSGSRFGLKGSEDLGNGLKAVFQLENGFNMDDGKLGQGGRLFGREASLGLAGKFGSLTWGRFGSLGSGTGSQDMLGNMDPFSTGFMDAGIQATQAFTSLRVDNSVAFKTNVYSGFQAGLMYSFAVDGQEVADADKNNRLTGLAATYTVGKLWAGLSYEMVEFADATPAKEDDKVLKFGVNYDFGMVKPMFSYSRAEGAQKIGDFSLAGTGVKSDAYMIGATAPIMGGKLMASYQMLDIDDQGVKAGRDVFSVGYDYPFSKRTNLYAVYSYSKGDDMLDENGYKGAKAADPAKPTAIEKAAIDLDSGIATANRSVVQIGLRHKF